MHVVSVHSANVVTNDSNRETERERERDLTNKQKKRNNTTTFEQITDWMRSVTILTNWLSNTFYSLSHKTNKSKLMMVLETNYNLKIKLSSNVRGFTVKRSVILCATNATKSVFGFCTIHSNEGIRDETKMEIYVREWSTKKLSSTFKPRVNSVDV